MRIGVDIRALRTDHGVSHYTHWLLATLISQYPKDRWMLLQTGRAPYRLPDDLRGRNVSFRHERRSNKMLNARLALLGQPHLDQLLGDVDVFFAPNIGFLRVAPSTPLVITFHDLSFVWHPQFYRPRERLWHQLVRPRTLAKRADQLIAVSEQTKTELSDCYGISPDRVTVIHSGIDDVYRRPVSPNAQRRLRQAYQLPPSFVLFLGALGPRKNVTKLLKAYGRAKAQGLKAGLVLAGPGTETLAGFVRKLALPDVHLLGYVPESDKPALYAAATAVTLTSYHEGFGFPPLEALACGTPSIVSDLPVFEETLGSAALRVPPDDVAALTESLVHLEQQAALRQRLIKRGQRCLKRLTWPETAKRTHQALAAAAKKQSHA